MATTARPVVLVLPARDEELSVGDVVGRAPAGVHGHPVVCIVVDDGSRDRTGEKAAGAGAQVVRQPPRGLGAAVRTGFAAALELHPVAVAFCDADGEYAPEELDRMVAPILVDDADYVVGSRFAGDIDVMHPHRRVGNRVLTRAVAVLSRRPVTDGQSGYRALSLAAVRAAEIIHDYNYAQVLTLDLVRKGFRYTEVPISYSFRREGRSFVRLVPYLRNVVPAVWRELRSPAALPHDVVTHV
jgi:glycosyltransferase involved in cell wall biosynthesis